MASPYEYSPLPPWPRTDYCGALRAADAGREVALWGWVASRRDHGGLIFIDLRDREGILQLVFNPATAGAAHEVAGRARAEYYLAARGKVVMRAEGTVNAELATGMVEIAVTEAHILNSSQPPPFPIDAEATAEDIRLRYRYLDLRRPAMQRNLRRRALAVQATRSYLDGAGFVEIETPILWRARLPGAEPRQPGPLLRTAPIPAAAQAAFDGERLRPLLSDCAMLSRRGPAGESSARVQPGRYRADLSAG